MKPSIALPHNRLPNAPTPEFSRHILAPRPIPLHTQTSQTSSLPFKPVRLLRAPLAAPPGACRLRSALPSVAPSSNRQPFLSVAFHHLSGANLAAPSDTNLLLLVPVSTDYFAPHHYPAAHTDQPIELAPLQAHPSALRSPCSTLWQPSSPLRAPLAALSGNHRPLYFHSPSPPSSKSPDRFLSTTVRSPQPRPNFQLSSGTNLAVPFSLCPRPASPLMRVARPVPPHFSNTRTEHLFIRPARPRLDISPSS